MITQVVWDKIRDLILRLALHRLPLSSRSSYIIYLTLTFFFAIRSLMSTPSMSLSRNAGFCHSSSCPLAAWLLLVSCLSPKRPHVQALIPRAARWFPPPHAVSWGALNVGPAGMVSTAEGAVWESLGDFRCRPRLVIQEIHKEIYGLLFPIF